jgi:20S proteasome subunit alpha 6
MSIGARSQSAKTYLEKNHEDFSNGKRAHPFHIQYLQRNNSIKFIFDLLASKEELVRHGLQALRDTLQQDKDLNIHNTSLGIVGEGHPFEIIEGDALQTYLDLLGEDTGRTRPGGGNVGASSSAATHEAEAADPMDTTDA